MSDLSDILLGKKSSPKATYTDYLKWVTDASADDEISKKEWREGANQFGFNARRARQAFEHGKYDTYANPYINKLKRNYYAWRDPNTGTVSLIGEGDSNYNEEAFQNSKFKGTDKASVVQSYNNAVDSARKKANIVYGKDGKYYITYKVGDWDVNDLDVTDADWFKDDMDRQKKAQLQAYGKEVDNYDTDEFNDYLSDDGNKLLSKINYSLDNVKDFDKKEASDQETIRNNIGNSLIQYYKKLAGNSWNSSVKADALWKKLMEYYNSRSIKWLPQLSWQDKSRYQDYTNLEDLGAPTSRGNLLSFKKKGGFLRARTLAKGGMIPKAGWGVKVAEKIGGPAWLGEGLDLATDFVPFAGTINRIYDKTLTSPGEIALSLGLDLLGPAAKGLKVAYKGYKIAKGAGKAVNEATKAVTKAENQFEKIAKARPFKKEYEAYVKAAKKVTKNSTDNDAITAFNDAEKALRKKMCNVPEAEKYVSALDTARKTLAQAQTEAKDALKISTKDGMSLAWRDSNHPWLSSIFGPNKKTAALFGLTRIGAHSIDQNNSRNSNTTVAQKLKQNNSNVSVTDGANIITGADGNQYIQNEDGTYTPVEAINSEYSNQVNFK